MLVAGSQPLFSCGSRLTSEQEPSTAEAVSLLSYLLLTVFEVGALEHRLNVTGGRIAEGSFVSMGMNSISW